MGRALIDANNGLLFRNGLTATFALENVLMVPTIGDKLAVSFNCIIEEISWFSVSFSA
jgi:hypothetical protein